MNHHRRSLRRRSTHVAAAAAIAVAALLASLVVPASAATWRFETLDGASNGPNGRTTNNVVDYAAAVYDDQPHVWYHDATAQDLRHAWWDGIRWNFETLDGNGGPDGRTAESAGANVSVTVWNGEPHVFYTATRSVSLRHAWWNGQKWLFETLDGLGGGNGRIASLVGSFSVVEVWRDQPHVFYEDLSNENLRHAWWNGRSWFFETLDGDGGPNGRTTDKVGIASNSSVIFGDQPHVWYYNRTGGDLRHAWWDGARWNFETLDGNGGTNGRTTNDGGSFNTAAMWTDQPHVWYRDLTGVNLRHAWWNGSAWFFETLDGDGGPNGRTTDLVGDYVGVAVWRDQPHIWYEQSSGLPDRKLRHAFWNGRTWIFEVLDGVGGPNGRTSNDVGDYAAVAVWRDQPHVWYMNNNFFDLRHGWYG